MKDYWFRNKKYGIGLEPASWQGWLVTVLYIVIVGLCTLRLTLIAPEMPEEASIRELWLPIGATTLLFLGILYRTSEKIEWKWHWGTTEDI